MVLKRNKSLKNIYKTLIKPGLVISGDTAGGVSGGGDIISHNDGDPLLTSLSVANSRRPSASAATDVSSAVIFNL